MTSLIGEFTKSGYEGFKFAAATTMVEQPNDVGHCHKAIKAFYKGKKYSEIHNWEIPAYLMGFDLKLAAAGMDSSSIKSYSKGLSLLETCLSKTCTIPMIKEGFKISGIYPVDMPAILSG